MGKDDNLLYIMTFSTHILTIILFLQEAVSDKLTGCPTLEDLGVQLNPFEDAARYYLQFMRRHRYYLDALGEVDHAPDPPTAEEVDRLRVEFY